MLMKKINIKTNKKFIDITDIIIEWLNKNKCSDGILNIYSTHTTCGISIMEDELLSKLDICIHIETLSPENDKYNHNRIDLRQVPPNERLNGHSHIWKLYFSNGESIPVKNGDLLIGKWQRVMLVELDWNKPYRDRTIILTFIN